MRQVRADAYGAPSYPRIPMNEIDPILELLQQDARLDDAAIAERLGLSAAEVSERIAGFARNGTVLGYHAIVDEDQAGTLNVSAMIEVELQPEREGGFDRIARRIAQFDQVESCYLMSGGYDLLVVVRGSDLREVARFVAEKLSTLEGVRGTATRFRLKKYKQNGFLAGTPAEVERLSVSP